MWTLDQRTVKKRNYTKLNVLNISPLYCGFYTVRSFGMANTLLCVGTLDECIAFIKNYFIMKDSGNIIIDPIHLYTNGRLGLRYVRQTKNGEEIIVTFQWSNAQNRIEIIT